MINYRSILKDKKFFIFICKSKHVKMHTHNFLELAYVLEGKALHTCDGKTVEINQGDYFVIDYGSQHSYNAKSENFRLINCLFMPELIDSALIDCRSFTTLISSYQIHFNTHLFISNPSSNIFKDDNGKIKSILLSMLCEFEEKNAGYLQIIRSKTIELLVQTMREIYSDIENNEKESQIDQIIKYIGNEYSNNITLNSVCKKFGYSFSYLSAKFKKEAGMNFTQYLQKIRVEQSKRLLANTNKTIEEIAATVGYRDIKSFYTVFRKFSDTTPAKFRKNYYKEIL